MNASKMKAPKVIRVYWNPDFKTFEELRDDGQVEPLRNEPEATKSASKNKVQLQRQLYVPYDDF